MLDFATVVIAMVALGFSVFNWVLTQRQGRRDLFLKLQEQLTAPEIQEGRSLIYVRAGSLAEADAMRTSGDPDYHKINRALAMFDVLSMCVNKKYVDRETVLEVWGHSLARAYQAGQPFIVNRHSEQSWKPWPHLRKFGPEAVLWHETHKDD